MNTISIEVLSNLSKGELLQLAAPILDTIKTDNQTDEVVAHINETPRLRALCELSELALEKPLTVRSRAIKHLVELLEINASDFKAFYYHLILEVGTFTSLKKLCKLYPSNIETSVILPYIEDLSDDFEIRSASITLNDNCWWYSNHQNSSPKGLIRLKELHPKLSNFHQPEADSTPEATFESPSNSELTVEYIGSIFDGEVSTALTEIPEQEVTSTTHEPSITPLENNADVASFTDLGSSSLLSSASEVHLDIEVPSERLSSAIPLEQAELAITLPDAPLEKHPNQSIELEALNISVDEQTKRYWPQQSQVAFNGFVAKESFIPLTNEDTLRDFVLPSLELPEKLIKTVSVYRGDEFIPVLTAKVTLRDFSKDGFDKGLALFVYNPQTELLDKELRTAMHAALTLLNKKAKELGIAFIIDTDYNFALKNNPKYISLSPIALKETGQLIASGISGNFVVIVK